MRAVSIPTERFKGLASHISVRTTVELLKVSTPPEFIAQNIRIVAFESQTQEGSSRYNANAGPKISIQYLSANQASAITFLVPVDLVQKIIDNMFEGQMQIIARNNSDNKVVITEKELPPPPEDGRDSNETIVINIPDAPVNEEELEPPVLPPAEPKKIEILEALTASTHTLEFKNNEESDEKKDNSAYDADLTKLLEMVE